MAFLTVPIIQSKTKAINYGLFYEVKMPTLDSFSMMYKCIQPIEHLRHHYSTSALSNEVYNFVLSQGAQKLSAIKV